LLRRINATTSETLSTRRMDHSGKIRGRAIPLSPRGDRSLAFYFACYPEGALRLGSGQALRSARDDRNGGYAEAPRACLALATNCAKAAASRTARSASTLRSISTPPTLRPCINWL